MKKAQLSFFVILGLLLLAVVVLYYGYQSDWFSPAPPIPQSVYQTQQLVSASIADLASDCAINTIKRMEDLGGYLAYADNTILFLDKPVNYWQFCQKDVSPEKADITELFEFGVEYCINENIDDLIETYSDRNVSFGTGIDINANILDNSIDFDISIPVSTNGYAIPQPYPRISILTSFGRIFNFAKDFVAEATKMPREGGRFIEMFTILSLYHNRYLPTVGVLTDCGETILLTPRDVQIRLLQTITYTLGNLVMWEPIQNEGRTYGIQSVNGNQYQDLNIAFNIPDDFSLSIRNPIIITNNVPISTTWPFRIPECITFYHQTYSLYYPVVVRVEDSLLDYVFSFGTLNHISSCHDANNNGYCELTETSCNGGDDCKMFIADCETIGDVQALGLCEDLQCNAKITVMHDPDDGSDIEYLEGATVLFGGCPIGDGETNANGIVSGPVRCGEYDLEVSYEPVYYEHFKEKIKSTDLEDYTMPLKKKANTIYHFRDVIITGTCENFNFWTGAWDKEEVTSVKKCSGHSSGYTVRRCEVSVPDEFVFIDMNSTGRSNFYSITNIDMDMVEPNADDFELCQGGCTDTQTSCVQNCITPPTGQTQVECEEICDNGYEDCLHTCAETFVMNSGFVESTFIEYVPAGLYDINAVMWDYDALYETGGFIDQEYIYETSEDLYVNVPKLGSNVYQLKDWQKICLDDVLEECELDSITTEEPPATTILTCCEDDFLVNVVHEFVSSDVIEQYCCQGPEYPSYNIGYPDSCGSCGGPMMPPCKYFCNTDSLIDHMLDAHDVNIICKLEYCLEDD